MTGSRKAIDGRKVNFEEPNSPGLPPDFRDAGQDGEGDGRQQIRELDKILQSMEEDYDLADLDDARMMSLGELSKRKSKLIRDEEAN